MNCFDPQPRPRRPSTRARQLSFSRQSNTPLFRQSTSSYSPVSPSFPQHTRTRSIATQITRISTDSIYRQSDASAVYYQDPDARLKLRRYLASPQKFDEAVEFGFPSSPTPVPDADTFKPYRSTSSNDAHAFLKDDVISFIDRPEPDSGDDVDDDLSSVGETISPATPCATHEAESVFRCASEGTRSMFSSLDCDNLPQLDLISFKANPIVEPDFSALINREMTLRMTLTRPDLRAPDEDSYGWSSFNESPPLPLDDSRPTSNEEAAYTQGVFATKSPRNSGVLKRIFSRGKPKENKI